MADWGENPKDIWGVPLQRKETSDMEVDLTPIDFARKVREQAERIECREQYHLAEKLGVVHLINVSRENKSQRWTEDSARKFLSDKEQRETFKRYFRYHPTGSEKEHVEMLTKNVIILSEEKCELEARNQELEARNLDLEEQLRNAKNRVAEPDMWRQRYMVLQDQLKAINNMSSMFS